MLGHLALSFLFAVGFSFFPDLSLAAGVQHPLQASATISPQRLEPLQIAEVRVQMTLPPEFKAYEDQFRIEIVEPANFKIAKHTISPLKEIFDKFTKKNRNVMVGFATLTAPVEAPPELAQKTKTLKLKLTYQACTETYCLFPESLLLEAPFEFTGPVKESVTSFLNLNFEQVVAQGLWLTFAFVFLFGLLTSFTPCIFPMIPITLAILGKEAHTRTHKANFFVSLIYVLGIATTYSILGLLAATSGSLFGSFMSHPIVLGLMCVIFLLMAVSMLGAFEFNLQSTGLQNYLTRSNLHGYPSAFVSGLVAGVVASPCVGPVLVGVLTFIAKTQNLWLGFWLMFVYALGMGVIFLVLGTFSQAAKMLPKSGPWMDGVKHFLGLMMLGVFYYYLDLLVPSRVWDLALGLGIVVFASLMGAFRRPHPDHHHSRTWQYMRKGLLQSLVVIGSAFMVLGIFDIRGKVAGVKDISVYTHSPDEWRAYSEGAFTAAIASGKPTIVDFHAEWCAACKELEGNTYPDPQVKATLKNFNALHFDATKESPELKVLRDQYEIRGLPTLLFFNAKGEWQKDLSLTEFENPAAFLQRLEKVK